MARSLARRIRACGRGAPRSQALMVTIDAGSLSYNQHLPRTEDGRERSLYVGLKTALVALPTTAKHGRIPSWLMLTSSVILPRLRGTSQLALGRRPCVQRGKPDVSARLVHKYEPPRVERLGDHRLPATRIRATRHRSNIDPWPCEPGAPLLRESGRKYVRKQPCACRSSP